MILLDTSGLFTALNARQPYHDVAKEVIRSAEGPLVLSPLTLCELDYLVRTRAGVTAQLALLEAVEAGEYHLADFDAAGVREARDIIELHADLGVSLADASIVVLAGRFGTDRVLTFDERHFRVLRAPDGRPFTVLPADL